MVNVPVIARRELNTYFLSLMAYVVLTLFALANGLGFGVMMRGPQADLNLVAATVFGWAVTLMVFGLPMITMRLLSEEASSGTIETLLTVPVSNAEVVLGKYVGALIFTMVMLVPVVLECIYLATVGTLDLGPLASGLLGIYLLIAQFLAVGLFCSSITRIQLAAALATVVALVGTLLVGELVRDMESPLAKLLLYVSPPRHLDGFMKGVIDSRDLVYFVATAALFLFLTVRVLESRRWR